MKLYVLVGVAGAGKSTHAEDLLTSYEFGDGLATRLSSDEYRIKLFDSLKEGNKKGNDSIVFNELHKDLKSLIESGEHDAIIYDATNINRRRRRALYRNVKQWSKGEIEVEIVYFSMSLRELLLNNEYRKDNEPHKVVPDDVIERMYKNIQVPRIGADCDKLTVLGKPMFDYDILHMELRKGVNFTKAIYTSSIGNMGNELLGVFEPHDCAPHHLESIDEHIDMCVDNAIVNGGGSETWAKIIRIAEFHDLGKAITKKMVEKDGMTKATYRGHAEVGANYYLNFLQFGRRSFEIEDELDTVEAIRQHMNEHNGLGEKNIKNNNLNSEVIRLCKIFAEIDNKSRIVGGT